MDEGNMNFVFESKHNFELHSLVKLLLLLDGMQQILISEFTVLDQYMLGLLRLRFLYIGNKSISK